MPTYEYACTSCGHHLEVSQSFSDEPLETCPNCEGDLRKVFGAIGIVLKGSGFYRNDSRAGSNGKSGTNGSKEKEKQDTAPASGGAAATGSSTSTSDSPSSSSSTTPSSSSTSSSSSSSPSTSSSGAAAAS